EQKQARKLVPRALHIIAVGIRHPCLSAHHDAASTSARSLEQCKSGGTPSHPSSAHTLSAASLYGDCRLTGLGLMTASIARTTMLEAYQYMMTRMMRRKAPGMIGGGTRMKVIAK